MRTEIRCCYKTTQNENAPMLLVSVCCSLIVIFDGMEKKRLSDWNMISPIKWKYDENFNFECVHLNIFVSESNWFEVSEDKILVYIDETMKDTGILSFYIKFTKVILNSVRPFWIPVNLIEAFSRNEFYVNEFNSLCNKQRNLLKNLLSNSDQHAKILSLTLTASTV